MGRLQQKSDQRQGDVVIITKTIASSDITVAAKDISTPASGRFYVEDIVVETDATGIVGPTNFLVGTNNAVGKGSAMTTGLALFETAVTGLVTTQQTRALRNVGASASTDQSPSVVGVSGVLESGKKLQYAGTSSAGTGAGIVRITIVLRRIDAHANILAA